MSFVLFGRVSRKTPSQVEILQKEHISTATYKLCDQQPQDSSELGDAHAKQIQLFNHVDDDIVVEGQWGLERQEQFVYHFKDDVLHRREVESLH